MKTEKSALLLSAAMSLLVGGAAMVMALVTDSRAVLLDGLFNLVYFMVALLTLRVAGLLVLPGGEAYPWGHAYFESLVNAIKGLLILGVSALALADSVIALATGGREILAGPAIGYAVFATLCCSATAVALRGIWRRTHSPLVRADLDNWTLNSIISLAVLASFCLIPLVRFLGHGELARWVDPLLVAAVIFFCLSVPVRMATRAILELLNRAPPERVTAPVRETIRSTLAHIPVRALGTRIVRPGRTLYVFVQVLLPRDYPVGRLEELDALRDELDRAVRHQAPSVVLDVLFTSDEQRVAPASGARKGALGQAG